MLRTNTSCTVKVSSKYSQNLFCDYSFLLKRNGWGNYHQFQMTHGIIKLLSLSTSLAYAPLLYYMYHFSVVSIWHARACLAYDQFLSGGWLLTNNLMWQSFLQPRLKSAFIRLYCPYNIKWKVFWEGLYQLFDLSWQTDFDNILLHLPNSLWSMTGLPGVLTSPRHFLHMEGSVFIHSSD
jgi:hypothetical protein